MGADGGGVVLVRARRIHTADAASSVHECMAVAGGRVLALGTFEALRARHPGATVRDYGDACVFPGFFDPHCHFLTYGLMLARADLSGASSWEEAVGRLADHRARSKEGAGDSPSGDPLPGGWLQGRGWDQNLWPGKRFPTRELLDRAFPDIPVLAIRVDGHAGVANARALEAAGLDERSAVPGGRLFIGEDGRLSGLLLDRALEAVKAAIPVPDRAARRAAALAAQARCLAVGLTSVSNAGSDVEDAETLRAMARDGSLRLGMYAMMRFTQESEAYAAAGPIVEGRFGVRSFKLFADGALGSRGAWLLAPYADEPGERGLSILDPGVLRAACERALSCGWQVNVHAIGDASLRRVLDGFEPFLAPGNGLRWRVEHAQIVDDTDLPRFARMGVVPSVQAVHAVSDAPWMAERLGPDRVGRAFRLRELLDGCGWLANGSDFPFDGIDPLAGFRAALTRGLSRAEALRAMTIWAAKANFEEKERGSLEPGKWADYVALSSDLLEEPEPALRAITVMETVTAGETGFRRS